MIRVLKVTILILALHVILVLLVVSTVRLLITAINVLLAMMLITMIRVIRSVNFRGGNGF